MNVQHLHLVAKLAKRRRLFSPTSAGISGEGDWAPLYVIIGVPIPAGPLPRTDDLVKFWDRV